MRQFWIALVVLSTLALAQNMVGAVPLSKGPEHVGAPPPEVSASRSESLSSRGVPAPATMMLLVAGLSGLTAVSGRNRAGKKPPVA